MTSGFNKIKYENWLTVGCAIQITQAAIAPFVQSRIDSWHQSLLSIPHLKSCGSCICPMSPQKCIPCICTEKTLKPCGSCVCSVAPLRCSFCHAWKDQLESLRLPGETICRNSWENCIWKDFDKVSWELAKLFMSPLGLEKSNVKDAASTDLGGLMNLLERLQLIVPFASKYDVKYVRNVRNNWAHVTNQEFSDVDMCDAKHFLRGFVFDCGADTQAADKQLEQLFEDHLTYLLDTKFQVMKQLKVWLDKELDKLREDNEDIKNLEEMRNCITSALEMTMKEKERIRMEGKRKITCISQLSEAKDLKELLEKTKKLSTKMKDTVKSLRAAADYLDEAWKDCETARVFGRSAELVGGAVAMSGGLLIGVAVSLALPLVLVGVGVAAAGVGISTVISIAESAIDSSQVRKAQKDVDEAVDCVNEVNNLIQLWLARKDKARLLFTWILAMQTLEFSDPARKILQENFFRKILVPNSFQRLLPPQGSLFSEELLVVAEAALQVARGIKKSVIKVSLKPKRKIGVGMIRVLSVMWDAINLGYTIKDIVKTRGPDAAKWLRQKADELEKGKPEQ